MKDDSFVTFILDQLRTLGPVSARKMFGGHGIYLGDRFFAIVYKGALYFRTTPETATEYVKRGMQPFKPNDRQTLKSYYEVPADVIEDRDALLHWAARSAL